MADESADAKHVVPLHSSHDDMAAHALRVMLPHVKEELSLLNSIYELKDMKTVPRTYKRVALMAKKGKGALRRILGGTADSYLQGSFNVLPLINDVLNIQSSLASVETEMRKLLRDQFKLRRRHYTCPLPGGDFRYSARSTAGKPSKDCNFWIAPTDSPAMLQDAKIAGSVSADRHTYYPDSTFHMEIEYSYWFSHFQREHAKILTLLDKFGVNVNAAIIWNAIPWSFVVDWIFNVNRWIDQFKIQNMEPSVLIHRCLTSQRITRTTYVNVTYHDPQYGPMVPQKVRYNGYKIVESSYRRTSGLPYVTEALATSGLSLKEISLATALILSKRRRGFTHG